MKTITCWNDLQRFGIHLLTGEACGLSFRLLCDLTAQGKAILRKMLSIPDLTLAEPWNRGADDDPHRGSIMLTHDLLVPLGIFALLETGCTEVWLYQNQSLLGVEPGDDPEQVAFAETIAREAIVRKFGYRGTAGDRNVHLMTGRIT